MANFAHNQDEKLRFITKDATQTEKNMYTLRRDIQSYIRQQERTKKKSLQLAMTLKNFGDQEAPQLGGFLNYMSEAMQTSELVREEVLQKMTVNCVEPLRYYHILCNKLKQEVHTRENALGKEVRRHNNMDKVLISDSQNRSKLTQTQLELVSASQELNHVTNSLMQSVERFEQQKRNDMKTALQHFIDAEITHHAKAVELLSNVSKTLRDIDLDSDIDTILDRIDSAAPRATSPVNMNTFEQISAFSRTSASPMKSPLKSASGLYSPGSPNTMRLNSNSLFKTAGPVSAGLNGVSGAQGQFKGKSMLKMKDDSSAEVEEGRGRERRTYQTTSGRRSQSTMR